MECEDRDENAERWKNLSSYTGFPLYDSRCIPPEDTDSVPESSQAPISMTHERGDSSERESGKGFRKRDLVLNGEGGFEPVEISEGIILILPPQGSKR